MDRKCAERLRDKVNALIAEARNLPHGEQPKGVNWADMMVRDVCGEVSYLHDDGPDIYVDVEEAAPECTSWFTLKLNEPGVTVRCSW